MYKSKLLYQTIQQFITTFFQAGEMKVSLDISDSQKTKDDLVASMQPMAIQPNSKSQTPGLTEPLLIKEETQTQASYKDKIKVYKPKPAGHLPMRQRKIRYVVLAMAALLMFGNNYSFDNPQALQKPIMVDVGVTSPQYNLLYSAFSFPNIFLTLAGGFMIDYLGVRVGIFVFTLGVLLAQTIVAFGGELKLFWLMLMGRTFFGIASENLIISQSAIISVWFKGKELSTAIGIIMTVPELASAVNSFLSPLIYEKTGSLGFPLFVSVGICVFSLCCALILIAIDRKADKEEDEIDLENDEESVIEEVVSFKDLKHFNATFWILLLICCLTLGIYIPFLDDANDFYQEKFKFTSVQAGRMLMIPYLTAAFSSPFIGTYVDKVGKRRLFIMMTCALFTLSCLLFGVLPAGEELKPNWWSGIPLFLLGISFSAYSCVIIPSVQYIVEQRVMGTAFGLMGSLESIALACFPLIAASIVTSSASAEVGYSRVGYFYAGMSALGLILSFSLYLFDQKGSLILDFVNPEEPTLKEKELLKRYHRASQDNSDEEESSSDSEEDEDETDQKDSDQVSALVGQDQGPSDSSFVNSQVAGRDESKSSDQGKSEQSVSKISEQKGINNSGLDERLLPKK